MNAALEFFETDVILPKLNFTHIALIPKVQSPK